MKMRFLDEVKEELGESIKDYLVQLSKEHPAGIKTNY